MTSVFAAGPGEARQMVRDRRPQPRPAPPPADRKTVSVPIFDGTRSVRAELPIGSLTVLGDAALPPHMKMVRVLTPEAGDERLAWDPANQQQVADARAFFLNCIANGLVPQYVGPADKPLRPMTEFDEAAGRFVATQIGGETLESVEALVAPTKMLVGG